MNDSVTLEPSEPGWKPPLDDRFSGTVNALEESPDPGTRIESLNETMCFRNDWNNHIVVVLVGRLGVKQVLVLLHHRKSSRGDLNKKT